MLRLLYSSDDYEQQTALGKCDLEQNGLHRNNNKKDELFSNCKRRSRYGTRWRDKIQAFCVAVMGESGKRYGRLCPTLNAMA